MKRELMDILACPMCKGELELSVEEEYENEIVTGSLYCQKCNERYPHCRYHPQSAAARPA